MHQKSFILIVSVNSKLKVCESLLIVLQRMVTPPKPILNACILIGVERVFLLLPDFFGFGSFEIFDGIFVHFGVGLAEASVVVAFGQVLIITDGLCEVIDCFGMVAHVLVHESSGKEDGFVIVDL